MSRTLLLSLVAVIPPAGGAMAQLSFPLDSTTLLIDVVVDSDRVNIPWEILWGPDDRLWMTDGPLITRWDPLTDVIDTLLDRGHGNGLGMALHPDFPNTPIVMAVFDTSAYYGSGQLCEVSRLTYDAVNDTFINETVLFTYAHFGEHAGGRLLFDLTGHVLLTTADYYFHGPDTLFNNMGKTLRFSTDGTVPAGNPRPDYTWTWGHRNPQGLAMLPNGAVVNSEHGQMFQANEVNLLQVNEDHGYPYYDGNACFLFPDTCTSSTYTFTHPIWAFTHPPSGCEFYSSTVIPEFTGKLLTCILWHTGLEVFGFTPDLDSIITEEYLSGGAFSDMVRNRDIAIRPDGSFYLITNDRQDARIRLVHPDLSTSTDHRSDAPAPFAWPNPATDRLVVMTGLRQGSVEIFDSNGRRARTVVHPMGDRSLIDIAALVPGLYTVRTADRTVRFVKQ